MPVAVPVDEAVAATYGAEIDAISVKLASGIEIVVLRELLQGLKCASAQQLSDVQIVGAQWGLHWEALDVEHYVPSLIEGIRKPPLDEHDRKQRRLGAQ